MEVLGPDCTIDVIVTTVYGRYHKYVRRWLRHLRRVGFDGRIIVMSLDGKSLASADRLVEVECLNEENLRWGSGDYIRMRRIADLCRQGLCCAQIDVDTFFYQNPALLARLPFPFIASRAFNMPMVVAEAWGFVLCTGFYIAKPAAVALLDTFLENGAERSGLDQEDVNRYLLDQGMRWDTVSLEGMRQELGLRDCLAVSTDRRICVLPYASLTRSLASNQFLGIHSQEVLPLHRGALAGLLAEQLNACREIVRKRR